MPCLCASCVCCVAMVLVLAASIACTCAWRSTTYAIHMPACSLPWHASWLLDGEVTWKKSGGWQDLDPPAPCFGNLLLFCVVRVPASASCEFGRCNTTNVKRCGPGIVPSAGPRILPAGWLSASRMKISEAVFNICHKGSIVE